MSTARETVAFLLADLPNKRWRRGFVPPAPRNAVRECSIHELKSCVAVLSAIRGSDPTFDPNIALDRVPLDRALEAIKRTLGCSPDGPMAQRKLCGAIDDIEQATTRRQYSANDVLQLRAVIDNLSWLAGWATNDEGAA